MKTCGERESFVCVEGCTLCCRGILSLSVAELLRIEEFQQSRGESPLKTSAEGCPFRGEFACRVYPVRPFMCRLFGFHYVHPQLRGQPFCPKAARLRSGDLEAEEYREYRRQCWEQGFVLLGRPPGGAEPAAVLLADNRQAVQQHPWLERFREILTGGDQCFPVSDQIVV